MVVPQFDFLGTCFVPLAGRGFLGLQQVIDDQPNDPLAVPHRVVKARLYRRRHPQPRTRPCLPPGRPALSST